MSQEKSKKKIIRIDKEESTSLSAFIERPAPNKEEVINFEKVIQKEAKHQEIDSNLEEIYKDKKGNLVDVKKVNKKKKTALILRIFTRLMVFAFIVIALYLAYLHFFTNTGDLTAVTLKIDGPEKIISGEEFSYLIKYENKTNFNLGEIHLELNYPENFIFTSANPLPDRANNSFNLPNLAPGAKAEITVVGMIINHENSVNSIKARLNYIPTNFSSEFKIEDTAITLISGLGFEVDLDYPSTFFTNQENEINLNLFALEENYLDNFLFKFILPDSSQFKLASSTAEDLSKKNIEISEEGINHFLISGFNKENPNINLKFLYSIKNQDSLSDKIQLKFALEKRVSDGQLYGFWEKNINTDLNKSDLNLSLYLNDDKTENLPVNFNDRLDYKIVYNNQGLSTFKDLAIMLVLDGELFDWDSLDLKTEAEVKKGKTITWTKEHIADLENLEPGEKGEIELSIKLKDFKASYFGKDLKIEAYSQYNAREQGTNKSNILSNPLNSDFKFNEEIRYFNDDNIPVGQGPLPPRVGELSSFRVYWQIENNLHALNQVEVSLDLPSYVSWANKAMASTGNLNYDQANHRVIWQAGKMPLSVSEIKANFDISIEPSDEDLNKILILSTGAQAKAVDEQNSDILIRNASPSTTKLENDEIAQLNNSGRVE